MIKGLFLVLIVCVVGASACAASVDEIVAADDDVAASVDEIVAADDDVAASADEIVAANDDVAASEAEIVAADDDVAASADEIVAADDDVSTGEDATEVQDQAPGQDVAGGSTRDFSVLASLALIPESAKAEASSALQVSVGDLEAAADQARLRPPLDRTDPDDLFEFFGPLTGVALNDRPLRIFVPVPSIVSNALNRNVDGFIDEVGFSPSEISSFVALESQPAEFVVFEGVTVPEGLALIAPGIWTFGEGDDLAISPETRTTLRQLGRPLRAAQQGDYLALSATTPPLVDWSEGSGATLADNRTLAAMATRLDEEQVVAAYMVSGEATGPSGTGLGWRADDRGPQGVIVLRYDTGADAAAALDDVAATFEGDSVGSDTPLTELVVLDSIDLRGNEIVAIVDFAADQSPLVLLNLFIRADGPFSVS